MRGHAIPGRRSVSIAAAYAAVIAIFVAFAPAVQDASAQTAAQARGKEVYDHWCTPCHAPGPGHPGTQSLEVKYRGELPAVLEDREDLTPEFVRTMVRDGILMMAPFRKTEVTDAELDDIAAYLAD
jgi:mono/diheme cytochrome c family protein